ncbi:hypothetical protein BV394_08070 [Brevirhabdus pacifica]|uniref:Uncharacterized protein n=1 Tax=Brevirhabdus pacifica TaxID=1267768 RepID=A0A1U7DII0_9RHOB|nr:hypothetical protein [Brevirhabdus pacifica]APX89678.1 hypothetical protein BV394_08070 [Brevirhabdus pacifica]OWU74524.1 hypothetical protein ATO5_12720 [Loktanella sp. 22II-4b]PJJ85643.1 hypothetical protein CLV77_0162 [Brevirhabdus pacifica]
MKRILLAAVAAAPLMMGAAHAYTDAPRMMVDSVENILGEFNYDIQAEVLTDAQLSAIYLAANNGLSESDMRAEIESALASDMVTGAEGNASIAAVQNILDRMGYEVDATTLSNEQVAAIYLAGTSADMQSDARSKVASALGEGVVVTGTVVTEMPSYTMMSAVQNILDRNGFEIEASSLTEAQVAQIYLAGTSSSSAADKKTKIQAALN